MPLRIKFWVDNIKFQSDEADMNHNKKELVGTLKEIRAIASGQLGTVEPRRMNSEELVKAGWGYLRVEEKDLTIDEARSILTSTP